MLRTTILALAGAGALGLPAAASAATAAVDLPCYVNGQAGKLALAGFAPNAALTVSSDALGTTSVTTDVTGSATLGFTPPNGQDFQRPGSKAFTLTATDAANPAATATATGRYAPLAFATSGEVRSPKALRRWTFSGFVPGKSIYAHFRLKGRTRGSFRFGRATGPCGEYTRRAPGIAIKGGVSTGTWVVQVDHRRSYSRTAVPRVQGKAPVYTTFRPRAAAAFGSPLLGGLRPGL